MTNDNQDIVQQDLQGDILVLWIRNPPVNAPVLRLRMALAEGILRAGNDPQVRAVALLARGRTFAVGADAVGAEKPGLRPDLAEICNLIESCPKPVVAGLQGPALGGGLELALAAHYRVAVKGVRLALPDVHLGIVPGAGGTQRLPRLAGITVALRMILQGQPVYATEALIPGLLDRVVTGDIEGAAIALARDMADRPVVPTCERRDGLSDPAAYAAAIAQARSKARRNPLPGPSRIVDCLEAAQLLPFHQGLGFERAAYSDLLASPESDALRHLAFAERHSARIMPSGPAPAAVKAVTVLGISEGATELIYQMLGLGIEVTVADLSKAALVPALEGVVHRLDRAVAAGAITAEEKELRWNLLSADLAGNMETLGDILFIAGDFSEPDAVLPDLPTGIAMPVVTLGRIGPGGRQRLGLVLETDSLTGARTVRSGLAELVFAPDTAPEAKATVLGLLFRLHHIVVQAAAEPVSTGLRLTLRAALLAIEDQQGPEPVLALLCAWGLEQPADPGAGRPAQGLFGGCAGKVLAAVANNGLRMLEEGQVQRPSDIDLVFCGGLGFPRHGGGPMHWAARRGLLVLREDLRKWAAEEPELFTPAPLLDALIRKGISLADLNSDQGGKPYAAMP